MVNPPWVVGQEPNNPFANYGQPQPQQTGVQDPWAMIQSILGQQAPNFSQYAQQQLAPIYAPQYQALRNTENNTRQNGARADAQLAAMYNALAGGIDAQAPVIKGNYATEKASLNKGYTDARNQVGKNYQNANNETVALMQKLGIQAAAADPRTIQQNQTNQALLQSMMDASNQGYQQAADTQQKGSLDYNIQQGNSSRAAGTQARYQNQLNLVNALNSLQNQGLQLQSQQAQAEAQLAGQYGSTWAQQQQALANMAYQSYANQLDEQTKLQIAALQAMPNQYQQYRMMGPMDKTYSEAARLFGTDSDAASKSVNLALSVNPNNVRNPYEYIQQVLASKNNSNDPALRALPDDQVRTLAGFLWAQLNPQSQPSYGAGFNYGQ